MPGETSCECVGETGRKRIPAPVCIDDGPRNARGRPAPRCRSGGVASASRTLGDRHEVWDHREISVYIALSGVDGAGDQRIQTNPGFKHHVEDPRGGDEHTGTTSGSQRRGITLAKIDRIHVGERSRTQRITDLRIPHHHDGPLALGVGQGESSSMGARPAWPLDLYAVSCERIGEPISTVVRSTTGVEHARPRHPREFDGSHATTARRFLPRRRRMEDVARVGSPVYLEELDPLHMSDDCDPHGTG